MKIRLDVVEIGDQRPFEWKNKWNPDKTGVAFGQRALERPPNATFDWFSVDLPRASDLSVDCNQSGAVSEGQFFLSKKGSRKLLALRTRSTRYGGRTGRRTRRLLAQAEVGHRMRGWHPIKGRIARSVKGMSSSRTRRTRSQMRRIRGHGSLWSTKRPAGRAQAQLQVGTLRPAGGNDYFRNADEHTSGP